MKLRILFLVFFLIGSIAFSQKKYPDMGLNKVRIYLKDKSVLAEINPVKNIGNIFTDRTYYWYGTNQINLTQGGYSGRLLNGVYMEYFPDRNIKLSGYYNNGLKEGIWKTWDSDGILIDYFTWKKGQRNGDFKLFNDSGKIQEIGIYKDDLLEGWKKVYTSSDSVEVIYYNKGIIINGKDTKGLKKILKRKGPEKGFIRE
ncbi:MAG: hypothetical protein H7Y07_01835 [Pyrinomonadaceae bacterium]|nr:hypothetical protein [Sphingobacteriaceae bacterium]